MGRIRFLGSASTFTVVFLLVAGDARSITLPDTGSSCIPPSGDGCLKITNPDTGSSGPAIYADSGAGFNTGLKATGFIAVEAPGGYVGVSASGGFMGVNTSGTYAGVYSTASNNQGYGVYGSASGTGAYGVYGTASTNSGYGVYGTSSGGYGVYGTTGTSGTGVTGIGHTGVYGSSTSAGGGVVGSSTANGVGVQGSTPSGGVGVQGMTTGAGKAISGQNSDNAGYAGYFDGQVNVSATTALARGIQSYGAGGGVYGASTDYYGVYGRTTGTGSAIVGEATNSNAYAGYFTGQVVVSTSAYVGISGTGPNGGVIGQASAGSGFGVQGVATGTGDGIVGVNTSGSGRAGYFNGNVSVFGTVYASAGYTSSDGRLKKDVVALPYGLKELAGLRPVTFKWKDERRGDGRYIGFIAQDLRKVVPEVVDQDSKTGMLAVNYASLVPVLVKSIQEQQATIARQDARIQALEQRPVLASMFSGGINVSVAIGAFAALALNMIRRRKQQAAR